jgi:hypothetical protein
MSRVVNLGVFWGWILETKLTKPRDLGFLLLSRSKIGFRL